MKQMHAATPPGARLGVGEHQGYRGDIDGLRSLAIGSVVLCHAFPAALPGGYVGVDIFFVISGYLISSILLKALERGSFSVGDFYIRRVKRLFPALILVLASTLAAGYLLQLPEDLVSLGWQAVAGALFASNLYFWHTTNYFTGLGEANPLLHLWSLGIEEQFYLFWPLLLLAVHKKAASPKLVLSVAAIASFVYSAYAVHVDVTAGFYSPLSRFWELACGGLLASVRLEGRDVPRFKPWVGTLTSVLAVGAIAFCCVFLDAQTDFPGLWAAVPVAAAVCLIGVGDTSWVNRRVLAAKPVVFVGLVSYPLYLWHWPLLVFLRAANDDATSVAMRNATIGAIAVALLLAWLTYRYIEHPIRHHRWARRHLALAITLMSGIAVTGAIFVSGNGFPQRIPVEVRPYVEINLRSKRWSESLRPWECHNMVYTYRTLGDPATCFPNGVRPHVMLWGDSHAAALFSGMNAVADSISMSVWQITTDATAPLFDEKRKNNMHKTLKWVNDQVLARMAVTPPDLIVLHGVWGDYGDPEKVSDEIGEAVRRIQLTLPQTAVVVLGPVPTWKKSLPTTLVDYAVRRRAKLPEFFIGYGLSRKPFLMDKVLAEKLKSNGVNYVSAVEQLCHRDQCLFRLGDRPADLAYVDSSHLSTPGSKYLASHVISQILAVQPSVRSH